MKRKFLLFALLPVLVAGGCTQKTDVGRSQTSSVEWSFTQAGQHPERQLVQVIDSAEKTLDIAIYSLTYPDIVDAIKQAKRRGVEVRLITDYSQSKGKTQSEALKLLGSAGIPIKINKHSGLMHLKMTIADGKIGTTGSFNYSKAASTVNDEMLIVFREEEAARSFHEQFERMWNDTENFAALETRIAQGAPQSSAEPEEEPAASVPAPCTNPQIKGNINARGDKIYHVPGGRSYKGTKAEQMFCSEEEAEAAGFRKAP
ncbi:phospholipase D family protein [Cohnella pontilimi]|uniref:phospholipase D n=1 Tax=Cohnella pontilimi TaxID=2564100 RepID=A0A4U0FJA7_9BACL|nr:phospholipase D family protein [Cohnella pontilimi]TJY43552.1 phospholipase D family protein [Cohnella pontilimi]